MVCKLRPRESEMGAVDNRYDILRQQIDKAEQRAAADGLDLHRMVADGRAKAPGDLATADSLQDRLQLLAATRTDAAANVLFERILAGDELQPVRYLPLGAAAARSICRLTMLQPRGFATGFLIAPQVLVTNNHVFPTAASAHGAFGEFDLENDLDGRPKTPVVFDLDPQRLFLTSVELDFSVVAVAPASHSGGVPLTRFGFLPLISAVGKVVEGEWLTIIQHPDGEPKQICVRENKLLKRTDQVLWYSTDTQGGSSGSPVFNNDWQVVALHHKGVPEIRNGRIQTLSGRDWDERDGERAIKWVANEGVRISRVVDELRRQAASEPLLESVFNMTPERAQSLIEALALSLHAPNSAGGGSLPPPAPAVPPSPSPSPPLPPRSRAMATRSITVTLDVADDGSVSVRGSTVRAQEASLFEEAAKKAAAERPAEYDIPFDPDYESPATERTGYQGTFLGKGFVVPLPELGALEAEAAQLATPGRNGEHVLDYRGYSLVMHAKRKLAIYTAANIDGGKRFKLRRPHDVWRYDPRIPRSSQIGPSYYLNNQFDRGHLTRYEDMEYGATVADALQSGADTLHFTNCSPQHARFNQSKTWWQGLEQHVLEQAIEAGPFAAQVFTGPVLDDGDPRWEKFKDIQYPLQFWKVAVAVTKARKLFAAGFVMDQSEVIAQYGIEATVEVPFGAFKTYQVPITEIERLTGLTFFSGPKGHRVRLSEADPLRSGTAASRRTAAASRRTREAESTTAVRLLPAGYVPIEEGTDIILE